MATKLSDEHIDRYLRVLRADTLALPSIQRRWARASTASEEYEKDRVSVRENWSNDMDMFEMLAEAYAEGAMSDAQAARYLQLVPLLMDAIPALRDLKLPEPAPATLQRLAAICKGSA